MERLASSVAGIAFCSRRGRAVACPVASAQCIRCWIDCCGSRVACRPLWPLVAAPAAACPWNQGGPRQEGDRVSLQDCAVVRFKKLSTARFGTAVWLQRQLVVCLAASRCFACGRWASLQAHRQQVLPEEVGARALRLSLLSCRHANGDHRQQQALRA